MKILLTDIRDGSRDIRLEGRMRLPDLDDRMGEGEVRADVHVNPAGERWYLQVRVRGEFPLVCDRCRSAYGGSVKGEFTRIVLSKAMRGLEEDENEEVVILPRDSGELDLSIPVREALILALPMRFLCSEDCAGLDPETGTKKESENDERDVDPRWARLLDLKEQMEKQSASPPERQK